jgi:hypothetical protein
MVPVFLENVIVMHVALFLRETNSRKQPKVHIIVIELSGTD